MTNNKKIVSVIIPTYNREKFIFDTINSVYKQTYRPIELLIIDDGSTDDTPNIIKDFKEEKSSEDFIIKYISQKNSGAQVARNNGIKNSIGEYIQFLDSDDILDEKKFEIEVNYLEKNLSCDIVYSNGKLIDESNNIKDFNLSKPLSNTSEDYFTGAWQCMTALYKRDTINRNGLWNEELTINQDWEYAQRIILNDFKIAYIDIKLCFYRQHNSGNIGSNLNANKILGKELSTDSIYRLIVKKNKLNDSLKDSILKRYLYCIIQYGLLKEYDKKNYLINKISKDFNAKVLSIFKHINSSLFYQFVMTIYELRKKN